MFIFERIMLNYLRLLLWPFSLLYGFVIVLRNKAYDWGIFKSQEVDCPTIVVGNLAIGGAGKSPMTEYLIRMIHANYKIATLSRGYGRKTKGFLPVGINDDPIKVGDEPLQFKRKYQSITVAVCEDRVEGVKRLKDDHDLIILDDAYQHRALRPGFSILLVEYKSLFQPKILLPAGNFRDTYSQRKRANLIVISKSPQNLSEKERQKALKQLNANLGQNVLFSYLKYGQPYLLSRVSFSSKELSINRDSTVLAVTGIADPSLLVKYLETQAKKVYLLKYPDHHQYSENDVSKIANKLDTIYGDNKIIVTTEKDAQRLGVSFLSDIIQPLPILVLPVETAFDDDDKKILTKEVVDYCNSKMNRNFKPS